MKRRLSCGFSEPLRLSNALATPISQPPRLIGLSTAQCASLDLRAEDLELLHYYTNAVSLTLSERPEIQRIWQITNPKEAVSHSALMQGLLAVSALHLHHSSDASQNRRKYVALVHFDHTLTSLRQLIGNTTPEHFDILIALSMLVAIFAFALTQPTKAATEVLINHISETSKLKRGVYAFLGYARQWILQGR